MQYRREIDGLRAVAVLPVILFHGGLQVFSGGYVGVDVFFVISGYLITGILLAELERQDFSILRFYERRVRRILPALFVVILACLPFAWAWMMPLQLQDFAQSIMAVMVFLSNVLFWREDGYFAAAADLKPLLHTWSLAVEEQFYLVFPLLLALLWRLGRSRVVWALAALALASLALSEVLSRSAPSANFYLAPSRAWELLAGALCAFHRGNRGDGWRNLAGLAGLAAIVLAVFLFDETTPFPGLLALLPVGGAVLILLYGHKTSLVARLLSLRPFVGIGLISYSAYLWHQPLFAFARLRSVTEPAPWLMYGLMLASLALAYLSWRFVEQPFRKRPLPWLPRRGPLFLTAGLAAGLLLALGTLGHLQKGFPNRSNGQVTLAELDARLAPNLGLSPLCEDAFTLNPACRTAEAPQVLLWGDSFAMQLADGLVASDPGLGLQQHTKSSCSPLIGLAHIGQDRTEAQARDCLRFNDQVLDWLDKTPSVRLVILSSPFQNVFTGRLLAAQGPIDSPDRLANLAQALKDTAARIRQTGARVVVVSPPPQSGWDIGQCLTQSAHHLMPKDSCDFALNRQTDPQALLRAVEDDVPIYWLSDDICMAETCRAQIDGTFLYRDTGHLSVEGSAFLGKSRDWLPRLMAQAR